MIFANIDPSAFGAWRFHDIAAVVVLVGASIAFLVRFLRRRTPRPRARRVDTRPPEEKFAPQPVSGPISEKPMARANVVDGVLHPVGFVEPEYTALQVIRVFLADGDASPERLLVVMAGGYVNTYERAQSGAFVPAHGRIYELAEGDDGWVTSGDHVGVMSADEKTVSSAPGTAIDPTRVRFYGHLGTAEEARVGRESRRRLA